MTTYTTKSWFWSLDEIVFIRYVPMSLTEIFILVSMDDELIRLLE